MRLAPEHSIQEKIEQGLRYLESSIDGKSNPYAWNAKTEHGTAMRDMVLGKATHVGRLLDQAEQEKDLPAIVLRDFRVRLNHWMIDDSHKPRQTFGIPPAARQAETVLRQAS